MESICDTYLRYAAYCRKIGCEPPSFEDWLAIREKGGGYSVASNLGMVEKTSRGWE